MNNMFGERGRNLLDIPALQHRDAVKKVSMIRIGPPYASMQKEPFSNQLSQDAVTE